MENLTIYYKYVENCIRNLGVDPQLCRGEKEGQWTLRKGSANVWIDVWYIEKEQRGYFQVMAPVVPVPQENELEFLRDVLQTADKIFGVGFTLYNDWIWIKHLRETENLDESEVMATITRAGNYADSYDDEFSKKYNIQKPDNNSQNTIDDNKEPGPDKEI